MWVLWPGVNTDLFDHLPPQLVVRQHTPNRVLEYKCGTLFQRVFKRLLLKPAGIPTIARINLLLGFVIALHLNFIGIYNNDVIPRIDVGRIKRLVFAAAKFGQRHWQIAPVSCPLHRRHTRCVQHHLFLHSVSSSFHFLSNF